MNYRQLGKTGLQVSEIGFGAWGIGASMWQGGNDEVSMHALHTAADLGITFFDTALAYGDGHSERLINRFRRERSERLIIATKIPPKNGRWPARKGTPLGEAFPFDHIVSSTEKSLTNLGVDTIDIQQFHVWTDDWTDQTAWIEAIQMLKEQGKIRHFGISVNDHSPDSVVKVAMTGQIDTFQVIYNIFDQSPQDQLFPLCVDRGIGVIVRVPFDEGALTGSVSPETTFPEGDWRNRYFRGTRKAQVAERVDRLRPLLGGEAKTLAELALRFSLQPDAVSTVIPGMRTPQHVTANCAASDGTLLNPGLVNSLRTHRWEKNFY
jgi:aryl-alcohol dehydrogenase-like predicted oxidoreductase